MLWLRKEPQLRNKITARAITITNQLIFFSIAGSVSYCPPEEWSPPDEWSPPEECPAGWLLAVGAGVAVVCPPRLLNTNHSTTITIITIIQKIGFFSMIVPYVIVL